MELAQLKIAIDQLLSNSFIEAIDAAPFSLSMKRDDRIHPTISGNKLRKLKHNLLAAKTKDTGILTFGGAFSNHIAATAAAGELFDIPTVGIIRGEELTPSSNSTLKTAQEAGMQLHFVSRSAYREKEVAESVQAIITQYPNYLLIPEGGSNPLGINGCKEMLNTETDVYDIIAVPAGTTTTAIGIIEAAQEHQEVWVFSSLKGDFLEQHIRNNTQKTNWRLITDYHFGGYAKTNNTLFQFIQAFATKHNVPLDPIYNGKMMYGLQDLFNQGIIPHQKRVLAIHTGGLQGWHGFSQQPVG